MAGRGGQGSGGDCAALEAAYGTLMRATVFLSSSLRVRSTGGRGGGDDLPHAGGAKVVGNGLRELDRFLCLLLDEAVGGISPPTFDRAAFGRQRNAANKLRAFHRIAGLDAPDGERLRAIGRVRDCLHHCRGIVHDEAVHADLHFASATPASDRMSDTPRLSISFDALARICQFYGETGTGLMQVLRDNPRIP